MLMWHDVGSTKDGALEDFGIEVLQRKRRPSRNQSSRATGHRDSIESEEVVIKKEKRQRSHAKVAPEPGDGLGNIFELPIKRRRIGSSIFAEKVRDLVSRRSTLFTGKEEERSEEKIKGILVRTTTQKEERRKKARNVRFDLTLHDQTKDDSDDWWDRSIPVDSLFGTTWGTIRIALLTYTVFRLPYRTAFGPAEWTYWEAYYFDLFPDAYFLLDTIVLHFLQIQDPETGHVVRDLRILRSRYRRFDASAFYANFA